MEFINGWKSKVKQFDKIDIKLRLSFLTIFNLSYDYSKKSFEFTILNFTWRKKVEKAK